MKKKNAEVKAVDRMLALKNIKIFGGIFIVCFTVLCFLNKPQKEEMVAQTEPLKQTAKFEKVEDDNVNLLAGTTDTTAKTENNINESGDMKKIGDIGEIKVKDDVYTKIDFSLTKPKEETTKESDEEKEKKIEEKYTEMYTRTSSNIRVNPSTESEILDTVSSNYKVLIVSQEEDWYKIEWGVDGYAYIHKDCLK